MQDNENPSPAAPNVSPSCMISRSAKPRGFSFRDASVRHCGPRRPPGQSALNPQAVAEQLDALASRVRRISPPLAGNPNRFHEERSDVAEAIADLARALAPRRARSQSQATKVAVTESRLGRTVIGCQVINGRREMVQKRQAFAISVGEQPVKKR